MRLIDGVPQLDSILLYDDPNMTRSSLQEKVCLKRNSLGIPIAEYRFGPVHMSNNITVLNEFEARLRNYWAIASGMVVCECQSIEEFESCVAYKEAYFAEYVSRRSMPIDSAEDAVSFMDGVEARLSKEEKEVLSKSKTRKLTGLDAQTVKKIREKLGKLKFTKVENTSAIAGMSEEV